MLSPLRKCTRRLEFDAAHRVMNHESKCKNLHGHRYVVELTCAAAMLDGLGRVVDFGVMKSIVGAWIDEHLDHGAILYVEDRELIELCVKQGWKVFQVSANPTAENLAAWIYDQAVILFAVHDAGLAVEKVVVRETPNCWAEYP